MTFAESLFHAGITIFKIGAMAITYILSKNWVPYSLKGQTKKAGVMEKVWSYGGAIGIVAFFCCLLDGFESVNLEMFILLGVTSLFALYSEYSKDAKMNVDQRKTRDYETSVDNSKFDSEW